MTLFRFVLTFMLGLLHMLAQQQVEQPVDSLPNNSIRIMITHINSDKGKIVLGLYDSEQSFNQKKHLKGGFIEIKDKKAEMLLENVPNGTYAIICYHDENDNDQLDFEGFMPTEDYGTSNNPITFGPPTFKASSFTLENENKAIEIRF